MIVSFEIESERIGVHQCLSTLPKDIAGSLEELHFDPAHLLLHFIHSFLHLVQELVFQSQRLVVIVITLVIVQVTLQSLSGSILFASGLLGVVLVEAIAVVPGRAVRFPSSQTHPAEVVLARLILADDVIAPSVLLDRRVTLGTFLGVRGDPVARLAVVVALLLPTLQPFALDRLVPRLSALETKRGLAGGASDHGHVTVRGFDGVGAVLARTPAHVSIALHEGVGDQVLILATHVQGPDQIQDGLVVDENVALRRTGDRLSDSFQHDLRGQIVSPAGDAEDVSTLQAGHLVRRASGTTDQTGLFRGRLQRIARGRGRGRRAGVLPTCRAMGGRARRLHWLLEGIDDVCLTKEFILVMRIVEAFHQLLLVPTEVMK